MATPQVLATRQFKVLLSTLGALMSQAARRSPAFWRQCTGDVVVEVSSRDGVAHTYIFSRRAMVSRPGPAAPTTPTVALCFDTAADGFRCLSSPKAVGLVVKSLLARTAEVSGNPVLFLWFYGLTRIVVPIGRTGPLPGYLPGDFTLPDPHSKVHGRITREPAVSEIDPAWTDAIAARRTMVMVRGVAGEPFARW
ncbi:MAG: hypothetical protein ACRDY7_16015 [Acidimicrobiia bacterium]